ncbi:Arabinanase/levansucrase/invertase [Anaeromyces robustus]|uniref:Arabinanase/levansucrase/invertase n=1 Tax=Anaeromyces robustus TaxID=1754192 RepID=A0A1Y1VTG3_9FUNG|nr:Arabinanase/levansucrase/invertase [Anaeromyces robustus]|eukprot:ORX64473.1 Arabinanase/levansucrase/invertase [Anaeromyces robustus]
MKTLFLYFVVFTVLLINNVTYGAGAGSFNGVQAGKAVKPVSNKNPLITHRYSADPGVMVYNDRVYVYATNDGDVANRNVGDNTYEQINTINCMSSDDLVNWTDHGPIAAAGQGGAAKWAKNSWAPTAAHKTINGKEKFFLYFANSGAGIGVLVSDSPTGPFTDPIGKALITPQTPNCASVTWLFDPAVLVDTDGTGYLYFGGGVPQGQDANPKTIRVVKLGPDMTSLAGNPETIDAPWVFEDSGINKIGNTYVYSYCTNWANGPHGNARIGYMTSNSPMGPFTFQGTCFNNPGDFFQTTGNNHHTIIEFKGKYYIFYHTEWLNKQVLGSQKGYRTTHVNEMPVNGNKLGDAKGTLTGVTQVKDVDGSAVNPAANMAWQNGISVKGQGAVLPVSYTRGAWTGVSNVALGGASSITLKASSQSGATIKICTESENGQAIGYVDIPAGGSLQNVSGTLSGATGTKNLFFVSSGDATIESWQLGGGTGGGNTGANTTAGTPAANTGANTTPETPATGNTNTTPETPAIGNTNTTPETPTTGNTNTTPEAPANTGGAAPGGDVGAGGFGGAPAGGAPAGGDAGAGGFPGFGNFGGGDAGAGAGGFPGFGNFGGGDAGAGAGGFPGFGNFGGGDAGAGAGGFPGFGNFGGGDAGAGAGSFPGFGGFNGAPAGGNAGAGGFPGFGNFGGGDAGAGAGAGGFGFGAAAPGGAGGFPGFGGFAPVNNAVAPPADSKPEAKPNADANPNSDCWSEKLGYKCCSTCGQVYYADKDGEWGYTNDWCGIPSSCKMNNASSATACTAPDGYKCCKESCAYYDKDSKGYWGLENKEWCYIDTAKCDGKL